MLEAAGKDEEEKGIPTVGKAGYALWAKAERVGHPREGFRVHNVLSCRPPDNNLVGAPYEREAIAHCAPNLDATILEHTERCTLRWEEPHVILTLGKVAFKRVMGLDDRSPLLDSRRKLDYHNYPHWSERYGCWVIAAPHPSYLVRGNQGQTPVLTFAFEQAVRIASTPGYKPEAPAHLCDPAPHTFREWVREYVEAQRLNPEVFLAYDIETPFKQGSDEEDVAREEDSDYTILRCSYAYGAPGEPPVVVSAPWTAPLHDRACRGVRRHW